MSNDGKLLETLVKQIEELHLPDDFSIKPNEKVFNENGEQVAEFDIRVDGKFGSTRISWLIECRDRPSDGKAPGSWIEQLAGRKQRWGFNKVTAVSTTGFSPSAIDAATDYGIELRTVEDATLSDVANWIAIENVTLLRRHTNLTNVRFLLSPDECKERANAVLDLIAHEPGGQQILKTVETNEFLTPTEACLAAMKSIGDPFEGLLEDAPPVGFTFTASYPNQDYHFVIETDLGPVRIQAMEFKGSLSVVSETFPISKIKEYYSTITNETISQTAMAPLKIENESFTAEFHNLKITGETHVLLRKTENPKN